MILFKRFLSSLTMLSLAFGLFSFTTYAEAENVQVFSVQYDSIEEYPDGGKNYT